MNTNNDIKNYSAEDISRYWQGKLSSEEMHAMERAAMDDPFLADAMEGYANADTQQVPADLAELRERLQEKSVEKKVVPMRRRWWRVAAVIILLGGASFLTYQLMNKNQSAEGLVQVNEKDKQPAAASNNNDIAFKSDSAAPIKNEIVIADTLPAKNEYLTEAGTGNAFAKMQPTSPPAKAERFGSVNNEQVAVPDLSAFRKDSVGLGAVAKENAMRDSVLVARAENDRNARMQENASVYRNNSPLNQSTQQPANRDNNRSFYLNNFSGRVVDADNNAIPQASLRVNSNNQLAVTDNNGYFNIRSGDSLLDLSVASNGYQSRQLTLRSNQPSDVVLDPIPQKKLASKVDGYEMKKTSGYKSKSDDKSLSVYPMEAEPVIGWQKYSDYLLTNNKLTINSAGSIEVVVLFSVAKNGKLSSFDIEKSGGKEYDAEAIRLIKQGPAWRVTKERKSKARVIVRF